MADSSDAESVDALRTKVLADLESGEWEAVCGFCGQSLKGEAPGSLWLTIGSTRSETTQELFVHAACLAGRLDDSVPFEAEAFEPDPWD